MVARKAQFYTVDLPTNFPVLSVFTPPGNLWDPVSGISVRGPNAYQDTSSGYWLNANYTKKWEREVNVIYIEHGGKEVVNQRAGIRVFGGMSRHRPEKSYRLIARTKYGLNRFVHPFFERRDYDAFKSLVLRNSSSDNNKTRFHDVFSTQLVSSLDLDIQESQAVVLFLNEEYMGIYNMREHIRRHFLASLHGCEKDSIDLIQGRAHAEEGDADGYLEMLRWVKETDLSDPVTLMPLRRWMDVRNYLNYILIQIYLNNVDSMGNIRFWRSDDSSPFRWVLYDTDLGLGASRSVSWNFMEEKLSPVQTDWFNRTWSTALIVNLLENDSIKADFVHQSSWLLNTVLHPDHFSHKLDSMVAHYANDVALQTERKGQLRNWSRHVEKLREYGTARPAYLRDHIQQQFDLGAPYWLEIHNETPGLGSFSVNGNAASRDSVYSGYHFGDYPLQIDWDPNDRYCSRANGTMWVMPHGADTVVVTNAFEPLPLSDDYGRVRLNEWHPVADSVGTWVEFRTQPGDTLPTSRWTFASSMGEFSVVLADDGGGVMLEAYEADVLEGFSHASGWYELRDSSHLVVDSMSWNNLDTTGVYERRDSIGQGLVPGLGAGTPGALNPSQIPPPPKRNHTDVMWVMMAFVLVLMVAYYTPQRRPASSKALTT